MSQRIASAEGKAQYSKPKLTVYGEFANLTAGGVGSLIEGPNMGSTMRRP